MYIHLHICLLVATPPIPWNTELRSVAGLFETKKVLSSRRGKKPYHWFLMTSFCEISFKSGIFVEFNMLE